MSERSGRHETHMRVRGGERKERGEKGKKRRKRGRGSRGNIHIKNKRERERTMRDNEK